MERWQQELVHEGERADSLDRKGYQIIQSPSRFCFGMDAVLLAAFANNKEGDRVLDLGTGTGVIPILMEARYGGAEYKALEIQADSCDMARRSARLNGLEDRIEIVEGDLKRAHEIFGPASFDVVTCNPPYMTNKHGLTNPSGPMAIARHELLCSLEDVVRETARLLRPGGHSYFVHRPFRLVEIMTLMHDYGLEPKRMRLVYPYADREPNMVLLEGVRGGRSWLKAEPPLVIYREQGIYTDEVKKLYFDAHMPDHSAHAPEQAVDLPGQSCRKRSE